METQAVSDASSPETFSLVVKWNGQEISVSHLPGSASILTLKEYLYEKTCVLPIRQKLLGGKSMLDEKTLCEVFKKEQKIMMMGTPEECLAAVLAGPTEDDVPAANEIDSNLDKVEVPYHLNPELLEKVHHRAETYQMRILHPFRPGKKLLVLDIDYTVFDMKSVGQNGRDLMRPYLHEFLHVAYRNYDIMFWSATSMKWIIAKMEELGIKANAESGYYRVCGLMDCEAMITVRDGTGKSFKTKPLGVIWGKYPQFSDKNSILVDDLRRNFVMNPKCGLRISQYRNAFHNKHIDKELLDLAEYLEAVAGKADLAEKGHKSWQDVAAHHRRKLDRVHRAEQSGQGDSSSGSRRSTE